MSLKIPRPVAHIIGVAIGVPASFVAGVAVFANGGVPIISAERIVPVVATYLGLGAVFGASLCGWSGLQAPDGAGGSGLAYPPS